MLVMFFIGLVLSLFLFAMGTWFGNMRTNEWYPAIFGLTFIGTCFVWWVFFEALTGIFVVVGRDR